MVKTLGFHFRGTCSKPDQGTKIQHAVQCDQKKERKENYPLDNISRRNVKCLLLHFCPTLFEGKKSGGRYHRNPNFNVKNILTKYDPLGNGK